jgi:hypothetical protein
MYERPKLNLVGDARDVILGWCPTGDDMDGTWICNGLEFALEADIEEV